MEVLVHVLREGGAETLGRPGPFAVADLGGCEGAGGGGAVYAGGELGGHGVVLGGGEVDL